MDWCKCSRTVVQYLHGPSALQLFLSWDPSQWSAPLSLPSCSLGCELVKYPPVPELRKRLHGLLFCPQHHVKPFTSTTFWIAFWHKIYLDSVMSDRISSEASKIMILLKSILKIVFQHWALLLENNSKMFASYFPQLLNLVCRLLICWVSLFYSVSPL